MARKSKPRNFVVVGGRVVCTRKSDRRGLVWVAIFYALVFMIGGYNKVHASEVTTIVARYVKYDIRADSNGFTDKVAVARIVKLADGTIHIIKF